MQGWEMQGWGDVGMGDAGMGDAGMGDAGMGDAYELSGVGIQGCWDLEVHGKRCRDVGM